MRDDKYLRYALIELVTAAEKTGKHWSKMTNAEYDRWRANRKAAIDRTYRKLAKRFGVKP